jgi:isoleucyl-tRNA synthetase
MAFDRQHARHLQGAALEQVEFRHPFYDRRSPVFSATTSRSMPAPASFTPRRPMAWKTSCPARSTASQRRNPHPGAGRWRVRRILPFFGGMLIWKANPNIKKIAESGLHLLTPKITHSYMHCWRHKTPIIYRATDAVVRGNGPPEKAGTNPRSLRERTPCAPSKRRKFFPDWGKARLHAMIANRPDWCISRQRNWGVPIPFFLHKETGELHPRTLELLEEVAQRVESRASRPGSARRPPNCSAPKPANTTRSRTRSMCGSIPAPRISRACAARMQATAS